MSSYTFLSRWRLPCPRPSCLNWYTPFVGSRLTVSVALYPCDWSIPHRQSCLPREAHYGFMILDESSLKQQSFRTHLKFENSQRLNITPNALIIRSTTCNSYFLTALSWGKLRKKPATKWFDKYFAPIPKFNQRFARQHDVGPPPQFLEASPDSGIAHHLSGTNSTNFAETLQKNQSPAGNAGSFYPALYPIHFHCALFGLPPTYSSYCKTPWSVFQDGMKRRGL